MKVLLVGEFSGVHTNLKKALANLGIDVTLLADGDGYKGFESDFKIRPYKHNFIGTIKNIFYFLFSVHKFCGYDVVQYISPFSLPYYYHILGFQKILLKFNKKSIYYACGTNPAYLSIANKLKYFPYDKDSNEYRKYNFLLVFIFNKLINNIDLIVPAMYDYYLGFALNKKTTSPICFPGTGLCNVDVKPIEDKIHILFGITREKMKGSSFILEALNKIKINYKDRIEVRIVTRLPYKEWILQCEWADILIDQCKSYSYGMNALFALEKGIIVLSGSEKEAMDYVNIQNPAIFNITPDSLQIKNVLESLIAMSNDELYNLKKQSIQHIIKYHDPVMIANKFNKIYLNG